MAVKNDNWLHKGTDKAWLEYDYSEHTERPEKPLEAPTSPVKSDKEDSSLEADLKLLDQKLRSLEVLDVMRECMGVKVYTTVKELEENLLLPNEIGQWYDKGYDSKKFIRAILNLKCWAVGSCWFPLDESEMYLRDLNSILSQRIPHTFSPEVKEAFMAHLDLLLDYFSHFKERPTPEEDWQVIYKHSKYISMGCEYKPTHQKTKNLA
jgi:hypothetical protein